MSSSLSPISLKPPELLVQSVSDGRRLGLQLLNVPGMGRALAQAGAWWHPSRRMWLVRQASFSGAGAVVDWLSRVYAGQHVDLDDAGTDIEAAARAPVEDYFSQLLDVQVFPLARTALGKGQHAVSFGYDALCVDAMRLSRGRFHKPAAAWQVPGGIDAILESLANAAGVAPEFVFVHERPVVLEQVAALAPVAMPIQVPGAAPVRSSSSDANKEAHGSGFISADLEQIESLEIDESELELQAHAAELRDYQVVGVRHLLGQSGACLGDDMGLGKTRQTVVATRLAAGQGRVLIVCPASLRINWEREIRMVYPEASVGMVGEDRMSTLYGCDWVVTNYERLGGLVREVDLKIEVMAIDEAHYLKEHQSGRTRNAFVMATRIPRRYVITGTPLLSREVELHTLLRLTGHPLGAMEIKAFRKEFSGTPEKRAELAQSLKGWMLRRRKDVLSDLGAKTRQLRWISPAQGLGAYQDILKDMSLQTMPKITKLRQCLETLKTPFLIETAESLGEDDKIIIFCEYMASVQAMQEAFQAAGIGCVSLVGSDAAGKRQKAIDAFQSDPAVKVFIGSTQAAGVGITLTAANYVAFASLPWTPAMMRQAEDRAYRLGQRRDVLVVVPLIPGTIDEGVWRLLESKRTTEEDVVEAVRSELATA